MAHPVQCDCGRLKGMLKEDAVVNRCVCYCVDCQAFTRFLGRESDILDRHAGSEIIQTTPGNVTFTQGTENLACIRLPSKGLLPLKPPGPFSYSGLGGWVTIGSWNPNGLPIHGGSMKRQLAAILYADVAGYSRLTGLDEEKTHTRLNAGLDLLSEKISDHDGKKVHEAGDAILAEFQSVTDAVESVVAFQEAMAALNAGLPEDDRLEFRAGVNVGEVIHDRGDVYGDGVNLAARVQELADPGGACVTGAVHEQLLGGGRHVFDDLGFKKLKNISQQVRVYALRIGERPSTSTRGVFFDNLRDTGPVTTGGCLCGEIRFELRGKDVGSSYCHCRMCQRFSGAPVSAGTGFLSDDFRLTKGEPAIYRSSVIAERAFCPVCGSSLWMKHDGWKWMFIKTANLDNPEDFAPTTHFGVESQLPWHEVHDDFPRIQSEDSPELNELWERAGVSITDPPRNFRMQKKPRRAPGA